MRIIHLTDAWLKSKRQTEAERLSYYPDESQRTSVAEANVEYQPPISTIRDAQTRKYSQFQKTQTPQTQPKEVENHPAIKL